MAKRETYDTNIGCSDCGARGKGNFTENENPVYTKGKLDRVLNSVSDGFQMDASAPHGMSCITCQSKNVDQV